MKEFLSRFIIKYLEESFNYSDFCIQNAYYTYGIQFCEFVCLCVEIKREWASTCETDIEIYWLMGWLVGFCEESNF